MKNSDTKKMPPVTKTSSKTKTEPKTQPKAEPQAQPKAEPQAQPTQRIRREKKETPKSTPNNDAVWKDEGTLGDLYRALARSQRVLGEVQKTQTGLAEAATQHEKNSQQRFEVVEDHADQRYKDTKERIYRSNNEMHDRFDRLENGIPLI